MAIKVHEMGKGNTISYLPSRSPKDQDLANLPSEINHPKCTSHEPFTIDYDQTPPTRPTARITAATPRQRYPNEEIPAIRFGKYFVGKSKDTCICFPSVPFGDFQIGAEPKRIQDRRTCNIALAKSPQGTVVECTP